MKRVAITIGCALSLVAGTAAAQSFTATKKGYEVKMKDGTVMNVDKSGAMDMAAPRSKEDSDGGETKEITLGGGSTKQPRTKGSSVSCKGTSDLLVENKSIEGEDTAVSMIGTCDADVFNTLIDVTNQGVSLTGTGELRVTDSTIRAAKIAINVTGSGDVIIEGATIAGPIALNITGTGNVSVKDSKIYGKVISTGTGKLIDDGGNEFVADHTQANVAEPEAPKSKKKSKKK